MNRSLLPPFAACLVALCLALSACGNKGDLFLPPPEAAVVDDTGSAPTDRAPIDDAGDVLPVDGDDAVPPVEGDGATPPVDGSGTVPVPTGVGEGATAPPTGDGDGAA
ncbi:hypothetical protein CO641_08255 [Lysobacteraceae bacterium NML91-0213]|nr:hypothetical protein CO641_08255 [Xanthomonadaceae bacterium NML91-0213]